MSRFRLFLLLCLCALAPAPGHAVIIDLYPHADAFVTTGPSNNLTNNNYGLAGALSLSAPGLSKGEFQSLMRFDVSSAVASFNSTFGAGNWMIDGVTLTLTTTTPNNPIFNGNNAGQFAIQWMQNDSWIEGTGRPMVPTTDGVAFANLASLLSGADLSLGAFSFAGGTSGVNTWTLALASSLTADIAAGGLVSLRLFAESGLVSYTFNSGNFTMDDSVLPFLSISAVVIPEPQTAVLTLASAAFLLSRRGRFRHAA